MDLLRDDERVVVDQVRAETPPKGWQARMTYEFVRGCAGLMAPRTVAIDDAIREHPAEQLVILGAGLDARAWRMPLADAVVFEVDHPATQADKQERIGGIPPTARDVRFVATDFAQQTIGEDLERAGHRSDLPSNWIWEGVVPYLTESQVEATVGAIARRTTPGDRLVVNYQAPSAKAGLGRMIGRAMLRAARSTDPWSAEPHRSHWTPKRLSDLLGGHGFATLRDNNLLQIAEQLELPVSAGDLGGSLPNGHVLVAERK